MSHSSFVDELLFDVYKQVGERIRKRNHRFAKHCGGFAKIANERIDIRTVKTGA